MAAEMWLPVVGYESCYEVSDLGRVRSLDREVFTYGGTRRRPIPGKLRKPKFDGRYFHVTLCDGKMRTLKVHTLVLEAFVGARPSGQECRHLDGNTANNALSNLRWGTKQQNAQDKNRHGTMARGELNGKAKLTKRVVTEIRELSATGLSQAELAKKFSISQSSVSSVLRRETWGHC